MRGKKTMAEDRRGDQDAEILTPSFERLDSRGKFVEVLSGGPWESLFWGRMQPGAVLGNHYHRRTQVFLFLVEGSARIDLVDVDTGVRRGHGLRANEGVILKVNESHAIRFLEESTFIMLKSRRYDPGDPDTYEYAVASGT